MLFQPGDLAACSGTDWASRTIRLATLGLAPPRVGPSHVALLAPTTLAGAGEELLWWESTMLCRHPCLLRRQVVEGVQIHRAGDRMLDYIADGGHVDLYRLAPLQTLDEDEILRLRRLLAQLIEARYDRRGALLSGTRVFQASKLFPGADLDTLFCSEFLAAILMRLGRMNHDNPARFHPARLIRELLRIGMYRHVKRFTRWYGVAEGPEARGQDSGVAEAVREARPLWRLRFEEGAG